LATLLLPALGVYLGLLLVVSIVANRRVQSEEDYIVAGRRLPLSLATATLFATWFGAGTVLTAADEIRVEGLKAAALEPYGAGLCLLLAGVFLARRLWAMKVLTISDVFARFGPKSEALSVMVTVPSYIGWIAVQLVALGGTLHVSLGLSMTTGILLVAGVSLVYTLMGGMWSVTITDAVQIVLIVFGVLWLGYTAFDMLGEGALVDGVAALSQRAAPERLVLIPRESMGELVGWLGVLIVASLGNLPAQELAQRIMAAKSEQVATRACLLAGALYLSLGTVPVLIGLAAPLLLPDGQTEAVLQSLALQLFSPAMSVVFVLSIVSVVMSTITSGLLAPATTLAHNLLRPRVPERVSSLTLCRLSVVFVLVVSVVVAMLGENAYAILEASYAMGLVGLFVPFVAGLYAVDATDRAAVLAMGTGVAVWLLEFVVETVVPMSLVAVAACAVVFAVARRRAEEG
jgi:Na+/proline symporter